MKKIIFIAFALLQLQIDAHDMPFAGTDAGALDPGDFHIALLDQVLHRRKMLHRGNLEVLIHDPIPGADHDIEFPQRHEDNGISNPPANAPA